MKEIVGPSLMQVLAQGPVILVYIVGLILSILMRRRAPLACTLAMCGFLLLLVLTFVQPFVIQFLVRSQSEWSSVDPAHVFAVFGVVSSGLYAIGFGLLTAGIFVQRR